MQTRPHVSPINASAALEEAKARISDAVRSIASQASIWIEGLADYYAAAAIYDQLSTLSDAELRRRGLSRATLAFDICRGCDRTTV